MSILALTLTIVEYLLLVVLLIAAVFIIVAVVFQKTGEDGLSSTIAGGQETYYGRDKSAHTDHLLFKLTKIAAIVFVVATVLAYVIQPDYSSNVAGIDGWKQLTEFSGIFQ
jgi:preprotein translocase subunit SecG